MNRLYKFIRDKYYLGLLTCTENLLCIGMELSELALALFIMHQYFVGLLEEFIFSFFSVLLQGHKGGEHTGWN